jgi:hypothetical protein
VKRLEAPCRSLDDKLRLYQIPFKHNRPAIPHAEYESPLVRATGEQRSAFLESKTDRLCNIEIFWVVMIDGSYRRPACWTPWRNCRRSHARRSATCALFSGNKEHSGLRADRARPSALAAEDQQFEWAAKRPHDGRAGKGGETFRILRRLVNLGPSKIDSARLCDTRHLDWQVCALCCD